MVAMIEGVHNWDDDFGGKGGEEDTVLFLPIVVPIPHISDKGVARLFTPPKKV